MGTAPCRDERGWRVRKTENARHGRRDSPRYIVTRAGIEAKREDNEKIMTRGLQIGNTDLVDFAEIR